MLLLFLLFAHTAMLAGAWSPTAVQSPPQPGPRAFHSATLLNWVSGGDVDDDVVVGVRDYLFMFGGIARLSTDLTKDLWNANTGFYADAWIYDVELASWKNTTFNTSASFGHPAARAAHASCSVSFSNQSVIVVHGGRGNGETLGDTWVFFFDDMLDPTATLLSFASSTPSPRYGHACTVFNETLYLYGGISADNDTRLWALTLSSPTQGEWRVVNTTNTSSMGAPGSRAFFSMGTTTINGLGPVLFVASGWNTSDTSSNALTDTWFLSLDPTTSNHTWLRAPSPSHGLAAGATTTVTLSAEVQGPMHLWGIEYPQRESLTPAEYVVGVSESHFLNTSGTWLSVTVSGVDYTAAAPAANIGASAVAVGNIVFVYGGFDSLVGSISQTFHKALFYLQDSAVLVHWSEMLLPLVPPERFSAASASLGDSMYVFGGWLRRFTLTSDAWRFSFTESAWYPLRTLGATLPACAAATAVAFPKLNQIVLFGGVYQLRNGTALYSHRVFSYAPDTHTVTELVSPLSPPAREMHAAAAWGNFMVIHGGYTCTQTLSDCSSIESYPLRSYLADLWVLNLSSISAPVWVNITLNATSSVPPARAQHSIVVLANTLFLYGGVDVNGVRGDLWRLNLRTQFWTELAPTALPGPRSQHFLVALGAQAVLVGGVRLFPASTTMTTTTMLLGSNFAQTSTGTAPRRLYYPPSRTARLSPSFSLLSSHHQHQRVTNASDPDDRGNGFLIDYLQDTWSFDPVTLRWTNLTQPGDVGTPLSGLQQAIGLTYSPDNSVLLYLFSGREENTRMTATLIQSEVTCPPGYYSPSFDNSPCTPCTQGSYSSGKGSSSCLSCGAWLTTSGPGATSLFDCNQCLPNTCTHGSCSASENRFSCTCDNLLYKGERCEDQTYFIIVLTVCGVIAACVIAFFVGRHYYHRYQAARYTALNNPFALRHDALTFGARLGHGAFGEVFRGTFDDMSVAIKTLHQYASSPKAFFHELRALQALHHPNIMHCLGGGVFPDRPDSFFMVMPLYERGDLSNVLLNPDNVIEWVRARGFALETAEGMTFLHSRSRIHRDLKAMNLLVDENWHIKIGDLGTVKKLPPASGPGSATMYGTMGEAEDPVGSVCWLPPEAARDPKRFTKAGDVFSYGIVMWEIVCRKLPYDSEDFGPGGSRLRNRIVAGLRPPLADIRPELYSPVYAALMQQAWAPDASVRPVFARICETLHRLPRVLAAVAGEVGLYPGMAAGVVEILEEDSTA